MEAITGVVSEKTSVLSLTETHQAVEFPLVLQSSTVGSDFHILSLDNIKDDRGFNLALAISYFRLSQGLPLRPWKNIVVYGGKLITAPEALARIDKVISRVEGVFDPKKSETSSRFAITNDNFIAHTEPPSEPFPSPSIGNEMVAVPIGPDPWPLQVKSCAIYYYHT